MCLFMSMIFILIQIKFGIEINNDKLLETTWEQKEGKKFIVTSSAQQHGAQVYLKENGMEDGKKIGER